MIRYIDAHSHLCATDFDEDLDEVLENAKKVGVVSCLVVAECAEEFPKILKLAEKYPGLCLPCFGVHPVQGDRDGSQGCVTEAHFDEALPLIEEHHDKLFAIGECGLDFTPWYCKNAGDKDVQRKVLARHAEIAKKYDLPLNVHSRSAGRPTIALLKEAGAEKVLLHAFDGNPKVAMDGVRQGYYFSIPPCISRSEQKQRLVEKVPLENLLLETDSPALGPEKQVRNVPSNITISCEFIAKIKKVDPETVARITCENAMKLFPKIKTFMK